MEDEEEISTTPFWAQSSSHFRRSHSLFLNSGVLLFTLCIAFSLFIFFSLRPNFFKKSWDSLNITLVFLALLFGFLSRNINHDHPNHNNNIIISTPSCNNNNRNENEVIIKSNGSTPRGWYEYPDRTAVIGLRRSYSSYPDLREIHDAGGGGDRWRFYDDTSLVSRSGDRWRYDDDVPLETRPEEASRVSPVRPVVDTGTVRIKEGAREAKISDFSGFGSSLNESRESADRKFINDTRDSDLAQKERVIDENGSNTTVVRRVSRLSAVVAPTEQSSSSEPFDTKIYESSSRKRGGNATKHFIDSFRKNKKKRRQKSVESLDTLLGPHPPPRKFFSSKKNKTKIAVPPPPPPPPPPRFFTAQAQSFVPAAAALTAAAAASRSLPPVQYKGGGGEIPPPPPLPPFKMASWKFVVKGDYVRIGSMNSSGDEAEFSPTSSESGGIPTGREERERGEEKGMFCPSPDVNSKADMFIAKFRAGLKLQKMNSMNLKQGLGLSNLGPATKT